MADLIVLTGRSVIPASLIQTFKRFQEMRFQDPVFGMGYILANKADTNNFTIAKYQGMMDLDDYKQLIQDLFKTHTEIISLRLQASSLIIGFKKECPGKNASKEMATHMQKIVTEWYLANTSDN